MGVKESPWWMNRWHWESVLNLKTRVSRYATHIDLIEDTRQLCRIRKDQAAHKFASISLPWTNPGFLWGHFMWLDFEEDQWHATVMDLDSRKSSGGVKFLALRKPRISLQCSLETMIGCVRWFLGGESVIMKVIMKGYHPKWPIALLDITRTVNAHMKYYAPGQIWLLFVRSDMSIMEYISLDCMQSSKGGVLVAWIGDPRRVGHSPKLATMLY